MCNGNVNLPSNRTASKLFTRTVANAFVFLLNIKIFTLELQLDRHLSLSALFLPIDINWQ